MAAFSLICAVAIAGCDHGPAMSQVRGKLVYNDGSVPGGVAVVRFQPSQGSKAEIRKGATAQIGPDGSFELYTKKPGDGVYNGEYTVTFSVVKSIMESTSYIPSKYSSPVTTPYPAIVVDGDIEDLKFEIEPLPGAPRSASTGANASKGGAG